MNTSCETNDLLVFSHLRWDFVYQRPQHLMSRHAEYRRVFYVEEPVFGMTELPRMHLRETSQNVLVAVPYIPANIDPGKVAIAMRDLVDELIYEEEIHDFTLWYYTPMALNYSRHLSPQALIYDCMDELSLYKDAPKELMDLETELLRKADLVFTGGQSLYEAKKHSHHNIHPFPSSIDFEHFSQARAKLTEPDDQINIPRPRVGFYGLVDERFDCDLLMQMADLRRDLHFVIVGPVVKIDPRSLPKRTNIHYLGIKDYQALPLYLAGWDCTIMPFALSESTRFISPVKTLEFLAAGRPVVSTPIADVVHPYGDKNLVHIATTPEDFLAAIDLSIREKKDIEWANKIDELFENTSWDSTFQNMVQLEHEVSRPGQFSHTKIIHPVTLSASGTF